MRVVLEESDLKPLVQIVVSETVQAMQEAESKLSSDRLAYPEVEAARLLGISSHSLRDARYRGEISASRVGKKVLYEREELVRYLAQQREN